MEILDGKYRAKAKSWALAEAGTGTPEVAVEFKFVGEGDDDFSITWHGYLSDGAFDRTIESLRHCGWTGDDLSDLSGLDTNEVELVIENQEYEGRVSPRVQWVNKPGGLAVKSRMSEEEAKSFAARMRDRIRALDAAGGRRRATSPKQPTGQRPAPSGPVGPEPPPMMDEDIPF